MSQNTCSLLEAEKKRSYSRMTLGAIRSVFVRRSQKTAIKEMCRQCMGSLPEVAGCRGGYLCSLDVSAWGCAWGHSWMDSGAEGRWEAEG